MDSYLKIARYRLIGMRPLICHNGQMANPMNYFSKELKKVSAKRAKTDADYDRMAELEFKGGLYLNEDKHPILPTEGIEAIIRAGAKRSKKGKDVQSSVICTKNAILEYDGPKDVDKLWADKRFVGQHMVKVQNARILRTRPMFPQWSCVIELEYDTQVCDEESLHEWLSVAGDLCGAFDGRPKYGKFRVERLK